MTEGGRVPEVLTVGHSTRPIEAFLALLRAHAVTLIVDVRTIPRSRRNPQFDQAALGQALRRAGIGYLHLPSLGGLRHPRKDSPNAAWQNASFRGFADYMQGPAFEAGLHELLEHARGARVAIMCAEAVPWRCHRSLIADALLARGVAVEHITGEGRRTPHKLTPWARVREGRVTYPGGSPSLV
jgi:uncharacterized protein (DUF488 family)